MECSADRIAWRLKANTGVSATLKPESMELLSAIKHFLEQQISCLGYYIHDPCFTISESHITPQTNIKCQLNPRLCLDTRSGQ